MLDDHCRIISIISERTAGYHDPDVGSSRISEVVVASILTLVVGRNSYPWDDSDLLLGLQCGFLCWIPFMALGPYGKEK